jgi:Mrp family chromosome partitioning ATPase
VQLYCASAKLFTEDVLLNRIAEKPKTSFSDQMGRRVSPNEMNAWRNSLESFANVLSHFQLTNVGVVLEMELPLTSKRLDCLVTGFDETGLPSAVVVEFKQWEDAETSAVHDCVVAYVGQAHRDLLHPSQQALQYKQYLEDSSSAFSDGTIRLFACSYLSNHQLSGGSPLVAGKFKDLLGKVPLFAGDQTHEFGEFLRRRVGSGDGLETLKLVLASKYKASKKLLDHVSDMINGRHEYVLLDEQQVVFNAVLGIMRGGYHHKQKTVVLVKGGPGTGKTIIALNLMAELSKEGYNVRHATGSRAFTGNLKKILGFRAGEQFSFFNNYVSTEYNCVDVLLYDEAHRLRPNSNHRFQEVKSDKRQIDELVFSSKVAVFLIDDLQVVRPGGLMKATLSMHPIGQLRSRL